MLRALLYTKYLHADRRNLLFYPIKSSQSNRTMVRNSDYKRGTSLESFYRGYCAQLFQSQKGVDQDIQSTSMPQ